MRATWQQEEDAALDLKSQPYEGLKATLRHSPDLKENDNFISAIIEKPAIRGARGSAPALAWYDDNDVEQEQDLKMEMFLFHESM